jgi:cyanophycinase
MQVAQEPLFQKDPARPAKFSGDDLVQSFHDSAHFMSLLVLIAWAAGSLTAQSSPARRSSGHVVFDGGGQVHPAVASAFVALAGGRTSHIVVIPTAGGPDTLLPEQAAHIQRRLKEIFGVSTVTVLHTRNRAEADAESFVEPLQRATGVWILGGFPERLVDAYLGTRTERAIRELYDRGGVVGGTSAGAMILASWLDTTDSQFTPGIRALIRTQGAGGGFGLLAHAVIFPHFNKRGDTEAVSEMAAHPELLGIGIDEETALVVSGDRAEALGQGTVRLYDAKARGASSPVILKTGDRYDLAARRKQ